MLFFQLNSVFTVGKDINFFTTLKLTLKVFRTLIKAKELKFIKFRNKQLITKTIKAYGLPLQTISLNFKKTGYESSNA